MKRYKTLPGLLRVLTPKNYFTLADFLSGWAVINGKWQRFDLSCEARDYALSMYASVIWKKDFERKKYLLYRLPDKGILRRVTIEKVGDTLTGIYCAGQDRAAEIRYIQGLARGKRG